MLKEERLSKIVKLVNEKGSVKTSDLVEDLDISPATVRRDLNELDSLNKLVKVFGGASSIKNAQFITTEDDMEKKITKNMEEKDMIGRFAGALIKDNDFVYMDSGTSVEALIPYIKSKNTSYLTNSISVGKKLMDRGMKVFILPGQLKKGTGALVGVTTCDFLSKYNFSLGFFGTNGIQEGLGLTTPDINEAMVKSKALARCKKAYVLADSSKFGKLSQVTFSNDPDLKIITCEKKDGMDQILVRNLKEDI